MSALVTVLPQTYRDVLAFLTSRRRTEARIAYPQAIHEDS